MTDSYNFEGNPVHTTATSCPDDPKDGAPDVGLPTATGKLLLRKQEPLKINTQAANVPRTDSTISCSSDRSSAASSGYFSDVPGRNTQAAIIHRTISRISCSSNRSSASSGYFSDISGRNSPYDDQGPFRHTSIPETPKDEECGNQANSEDNKQHSPNLSEDSGFAEDVEFEVGSSDNDVLTRENSTCDLPIDSSENPSRSSSGSGTSEDAPSNCLCGCSVSPSPSLCYGHHAYVVATQEWEQGDITDAFPSSVYGGQEIERWLDSTREELEIGPSLYTPPCKTDQSHDNLDVYQASDNQTTNECPPSATFDVILDCQSCTHIPEGKICRQLTDNFENVREYLSEVGDLKSVNMGCIILTFNVSSDKQRDGIRKAVQDGTLKKKIETWLQNNNQQQDFNLRLSISAQEETKAILDRPVKFAFCQCEKHWFWSYDQVQWYSVRIHEISREERLWRPLPADLSLMQRLVNCDQSPNQVKGKTCHICMIKTRDPTKVLEDENRINDTIDVTIKEVTTGQNAGYTSDIHRPLSSEGSGSSGYGSQYSSLSEEDTLLYLNSEEEDKTFTVDSSI